VDGGAPAFLDERLWQAGRCTEKVGEVVDFYLYLAAALVILRMLIRRAPSATAGTVAPPPDTSSDANRRSL
jgi:hypothetical protein